MRNVELHIDELKEKFGNKDYFQVADLLLFYKLFDTQIAKSTVNWRMHSLVTANTIHRIGRGKYKVGSGNAFIPQDLPKTFKINSSVKRNFPYLKYAIWHISEINLFTQHLISRDTYYVEVERDAIDAVFEHLREKYKFVLRGKANEEVYFGESVIVVRSLITGSPIQVVKNVPTITIEKLLVDLFSDKEFDFLQGNELAHVFNTAFSKYTINIDKLLRYASRKEKRTIIAEYIKTIK